jgi:yecA family protein
VGFINRALSFEEEIEIAELLSDSGPRSLIFARGVFTAGATSPDPLDPTEWLPMVLGDQIPTAEILKKILALLIRDCTHVAAQLAAGEAPVPSSSDEEVLRQFCRGYVQVAQKCGHWTSNQAAFEITLPLMVLSDYVGEESLQKLKPEAIDRLPDYRKECKDVLPASVLGLYSFFASAREAKRKAQQAIASGKTGRNELCPCGSGKKFKKCCGGGTPAGLV